MPLTNLKLWLQGRLSSTNRRVLARSVDAVRVHTAEHSFLVSPDDMGVGRHLKYWGAYGEDELRWLREVVQPDSEVLLVGSHAGSLAIPIASSCRQVEGNPATFELLRSNALLNGCNNLRVHQFPASDRGGTQIFLASRVDSGGSKIKPLRTRRAYRFDQPEEIEVLAMRLDDGFVDRRFDLIVLDIEGSEPIGMAGMPNLLARCQHLVVEFVPHLLRDVSGVSVTEYVEPLSDFDRMQLSNGHSVEGSERFELELRRLDDRDVSNAAVWFTRVGLPDQ